MRGRLQVSRAVFIEVTPERWAQVKDLFDAALASAPEDRTGLLNRRCAGDEELREEVESLLATHDEEFL
ncbi:MAG TPA: hypothetical protein VFB00_00020, partial [Terriglobales bacterium]|nr:hypothetical protein [Terriglobales bacterium]